MIIRCSGQDSLAAEGCRRKQPWSATGASSISRTCLEEQMENGLSLLGQAGSPAAWLFTLLFAARCLSLMNAGLAAFGAGLPRAWGRPGYAGGFVAATVRRPKGRWHGRYAVPYPGDSVFFGALLAKCWGRRRDFARCKSRKAPPGSSWGSQRPNQGAEGLVRQRAALEVWKGANSLKGFWCAAFWCHCASACRLRDIMSVPGSFLVPFRPHVLILSFRFWISFFLQDQVCEGPASVSSYLCISSAKRWWLGHEKQPLTFHKRLNLIWR